MIGGTASVTVPPAPPVGNQTVPPNGTVDRSPVGYEFEFGVAMETDSERSLSYAAVLLAIIPTITVVGNIIVVFSIFTERMFKTNANYYVFSLAIADIHVGFLVMPAAIYSEVNNGTWLLSHLLCDIFVACDVLFSTASILNLTVICIDRFVAVTFPIEYARQMRRTHVVLIIVVTWILSLGIATPVVCGLNRHELELELDREAGDNLRDASCTLRNPEYMIASSLGSFILPTCIVIPFYVKIIRVIRQHSMSARSARQRKTVIPLLSVQNPNVCGRPHSLHIKTPKLRLNDVTITPELSHEQQSNRTPGRSFSNVDVRSSSLPITSSNGNGNEHGNGNGNGNGNIESRDDAADCLGKNGSLERRHGQAMSNVHKCSSTAIPQLLRTLLSKDGFTSWPTLRAGTTRAMRRETKATITLAIVLFVYLLCWMPFFIVNLLNAFFMKTQSGIIAPSVLNLFAWLGYVNSALNPIIYGLFNTEYRKAFRKICTCRRSSRTMQYDQQREFYKKQSRTFRQSSRV